MNVRGLAFAAFCLMLPAFALAQTACLPGSTVSGCGNIQSTATPGGDLGGTYAAPTVQKINGSYGALGQVLQSNGSGVAPSWATPAPLNSTAYAGTLVKNTYTAAGAIAVTDDISQVGGSSTLAMTLAADTIDKRQHIIKNTGTASVTISLTVDQSAQTLTLPIYAAGSISTASGVTKGSVTLTWDASTSSYTLN